MKSNLKMNITTVVFGLVFAAPLAAQDWVGSVEGGLFSTDRTSTDSTIVDSPYTGYFVAGQTQRNFGDYRLSVDGRLEMMDDKGIDDVYETGPVHSGIIGLHFGREFGDAYFGAFAAAGYFDGVASESPMTGTLAGLEGSYTLPVGAVLYAQVGAMEAIGGGEDNKYVGYAARVGAKHQFNDRISAGLSYEFGQSNDCFVDCGRVRGPSGAGALSGEVEPGEFSMATLDASYAVTDQMDIVARYAYLDVFDENDSDTGTASTLYLGARWNFGARSEQTALTTPMGGFEAAGWMRPLD